MITKYAALYVLLSLAALLGCNDISRPRSQSRDLRLVSLSPAVTDILFDLGLGDRIVGVSKHCIVPAGLKKKVVGTMLTAETEVLLSVEPTHLFFQWPRDSFHHLARLDPTIQLASFRLETTNDILKVVDKIGELVKRQDLAAKATKKF